MAHRHARVKVYPAYVEKRSDDIDIEGTNDPESRFYEGHRILAVRAMTRKERLQQLSWSRNGSVPVIIEVEGGGYIACFVSEFNEPNQIKEGE